MKFLEPTITCLVMSHMKPYLADELESLITQTRINDVQIVVVDSGQWIHQGWGSAMARIYETYSTHPNIEWYFTGESPNHHREHCSVAYWTNKAITEGLIRGKYFCTGFDEDIHYPGYMETMAGWLDAHPESLAVYCSEDRACIDKNGVETVEKTYHAKRILTYRWVDRRVDAMQMMIYTKVLSQIGFPYLSDDLQNCWHSDGVFLTKVVRLLGTVHPINITLARHRSTPLSTYTPV